MSEESAVEDGEPIALTLEERQAIRRLSALAKAWPNSLWLFADGQNGLAIMKKKPDGTRAILPNGDIDPAYSVGSACIEAEGGGWH